MFYSILQYYSEIRIYNRYFRDGDGYGDGYGNGYEHGHGHGYRYGYKSGNGNGYGNISFYKLLI
jgi:hypothetical protein